MWYSSWQFASRCRTRGSGDIDHGDICTDHGALDTDRGVITDRGAGAGAGVTQSTDIATIPITIATTVLSL